MSSFLTEYQKQNIRNIMDSIHDTFARDITVYKFGQRLSIATNDTYNAMYKKNSVSTTTELVPISQVIKARIKYDKFDQTNFYQEGAQEKIVVPEGAVYIKVNREGFLFIKDAKTVELDGLTYQIKSPGKPEGMFGPQYYRFLLIPLET